MIGSLIEHYQIKELLGEGGMGTVYKGLDTRTNETIALKVLNTNPAKESPAVLERFIREGEALRQLNHPNIITMREAFEHEGRHYLVMEYIEGGDLNGLLEKEGKLSVERTLSITLELADALTRAHHLNVIHRDIKPANVLLAKDNTPRLTDFGIAQFESDLKVTEDGSLVGTIPYLSPEGCAGQGLDARSDIWSFGVLLYELLTGDLPFWAENVIAVLTAILNEELPDIQNDHPEIPDALADLIYRMLVKDPAGRIPSVRLVGAELEAIREGRPYTPPDYPSSAPPLVSQESAFQTPSLPDQKRHNLQAQPTPFIGRNYEIDELDRLIGNSQVHLITILGAGGMGKSRLAVEIGLNHLDTFSDGVYLVELAPLNDPASIPAAIADAINYTFQEGTDQKEQIINYFENKQILLIMDNFEHLIQGASIVAEILFAAPSVKILVTSRQKLNLSAENVFTLSGMRLPDKETATRIANYDAIQLFLQGAARTKVDFEIIENELAHISHICHLLDGIPLAILLATAWVDVLKPEEIAEEIQKSIDFLETESADTPDRHRSMRGVFEYSWKLLAKEERDTFMCMSVFHGGCTRHAAQHISGASIRTLSKLINKSVLGRDLITGRFRIHQLLRQLAAEYLEQSGKGQDIYIKHADYYLELAAGLEEDLKGNNQLEALNAMDADFENIRAAWYHAVENGEEELINNSMESLFLMTRFRSKFTDGLKLFKKGRAKWPPSSETNLAGRLLVRFIPPDEDPEKTYRQGLNIAEQYDDPAEINYARNQLGRTLAHSFTEEDAPQGLSLLEQSFAQYQEMGDDFSTARVLDDLSFAYTFSDIAKKLGFAKKSVEIRRKIKDDVGLANSLLNLALAYALNGEIIKTKSLNHEGLEIARRMNDRVYIAWHAIFLLQFSILEGDKVQAEKLYEEIEPIVEEVNDLDLTSEFFYTHILSLLAKEKYPEAKVILDQIQGKTAAAENNQHILGAVGLGSFICIGLGDIEQLHTMYIPQIQQVQNQLSKSGMVLPYDLVTPITAALIDKGEYSLAAGCMGKIEMLAKKNKIAGYIDRFPLYNKLTAQIKGQLGEENYLAAAADSDSVSLINIINEYL